VTAEFHVECTVRRFVGFLDRGTHGPVSTVAQRAGPGHP
jgi:hypothetical protein